MTGRCSAAGAGISRRRGAGTRSVVRPDVSAVHGESYRAAGFALMVQGLATGSYEVAVFAWSNVTGGFAPPKVVEVTLC